MNKSTSIVLLTLAVAFSQLIFVHFDLNSGISFHGVKIQPFPLLSFNQSSGHNFLTSAIVGYLIFAVVLISNARVTRKLNSGLFVLPLIVCAVTIFFELYNFGLNMRGDFQGQAMRTGWVLALLTVDRLHRSWKLRGISTEPLIKRREIDY